MQKRIRICQVLHGIVGGGSEQVVLNYCSRMPDIHFDLLYQYDPNPQILERFNEAGINCIRIPDKVHHPIKHLWVMFRIFKKGHYDVVHSHLDWFMNAYVMLLALLAGVPKRIAHHHQAYHPKNPLLKLLCALLRVPNKILSTRWLACGKVAAENGWGRTAVVKDDVTILPNAIDPERFRYDENVRQFTREIYRISKDDFVIGHVGRFFPEKNHKFIVDVFFELLQKKENCKLIFVGNGPLQESIRGIVLEKHLESKVIFAGLQKDTVPFYCAMDVLLLPSTREAFPMTLIEAQYNGLYCLVSDAVPKEVIISDLMRSLPINNVDPWVSLLAEQKDAQLHCQPCILNNQYDISKTYRQLESLYKA